MTDGGHQAENRIEAGSRSWSIAWLLVILAVYAAFRVPFVLKQLGGQDEQLFAPPGLTVAREGVPRIPFYPARHPDAFFYKADEAVFALPPGLFYLQAPFYLALPAGYPTGRWPCFLAGAVAIWLVYELARRVAGNMAGLWAAGLYGLSRVLFFAATMARPDQPCATCGLGAILLVWNYADTGRLRWVIAAGALLGLGMLCHPFAIIFCLLAGVWTLLIAARITKRLIAASLLTMTTLVVFALWLPLILAHRDAFEHQFFNNVLRPAGPGLTVRLLWPWPYVVHQARLLYEQAGAAQTGLMAVGVIVATLFAFRRSATSAERRLVALVWGGLYLLTAIQGFHPTKGYWCFTGALALAAAGVCLAKVLDRLKSRSAVAAAGLAVGVVALLIPESGLRTWWKQVVPTADARYDGPEFARRVVAELPSEGAYLADPEFVFELWLAGKNVTLRANPYDFQVERQPYDWLVVSRDGLRKEIPKQLEGELVRSFGPKDDPLACYAEVYRPQSTAKTSPSP
ncbi:hypothetical protein Pan44_21510 [Caulifigura coniformis]|uniref:Glycosyltransferase RgtA/B/C/D-like domain-containing protein n=1 Tax=Caulifigura coniformis TaxID=2527983 RepID=A0A517SDC0_9PLAN|nr:glycosyltransferase family 39 protein [Caulifigura coniformis]QDT54124.1 hypothetical protein Pan44_21510 [Caulifigura coniformis]